MPMTGSATQHGEEVRESLYLREDGDVSQSLLGHGFAGGPSNAGSGALPVQLGNQDSAKQLRTALMLTQNTGRINLESVSTPVRP